MGCKRTAGDVLVTAESRVLLKVLYWLGVRSSRRVVEGESDLSGGKWKARKISNTNLSTEVQTFWFFLVDTATEFAHEITSGHIVVR